MNPKKRIASMLALVMSVALSSQVVFAQVSPSLATQSEGPETETLEDADTDIRDHDADDLDAGDAPGIDIELDTDDDMAVEAVVDADEDAQLDERSEASEAAATDSREGEVELVKSQSELTRTLFNTTAENGPGCSYADAGTGAYAQTLCWIDFSGFTTKYEQVGTQWRSVLGSAYTVPNSVTPNGVSRWGHVQNFPIEVDLGGGNVLTAKLSTSSTRNAGKAITAFGFPTWSGAFLGNTLYNRSFYTGVEGEPAIYNSNNISDGSHITIRLSDIRIVTDDDQEVRNFAMVVADAESTDAGESIRWTTTGEGFRWLPNDPGATEKMGVMGNACPSGFSPVLNSALSQSAHCQASSSSSKNGTPMLATAPPTGQQGFEISQTLAGNGRQGVSFGILMARASIEVKVDDRVIDAKGTAENKTKFKGSISSGAATLVDASTGVTSLTSGPVGGVLPTSDQGNQLVFESDAVGDLQGSYTAAWQCSKDDPHTGQTSFWPSETTTSPTPPAAAEQFTWIKPAEYISCTVTYTPPYLTLAKTIDKAETDASDGLNAFTLIAEGEAGSASRFSGAADSSAVVKRPVAVGAYSLDETVAETIDWPYGYDWTDLVCIGVDGQELTSVSTTRSGAALSGASLEIGLGDDIACMFTNTAKEPQLDTKKEAFDENGDPVDWGAAVTPGQEISYRLSFDNSQGTAAMMLDHIDYLGDVLDDAEFVPGSIRISDGNEVSYPNISMSAAGVEVTELLGENDEPQLRVTGEVLRDETRTVWFKVTVLENSVNPVERENGMNRDGDDRPNRVGYALNNYLVPAGEPVPDVCEKPEGDADSNCVHHPIPAWSLNKNSRPASGAQLHEGGNSHYQITATKLNDATEINGLVFTDDLTHVFLSAGWAPDAAVPGGAMKRGIYFFDENNRSLTQDGTPTGTLDAPLPAYDHESGYVPEPVMEDGRWILRSEPVDVPSDAVRAEMWFAVQAGENPAGIPSNLFEGEMTGRSFTNYVSASSDGLTPNQCETVEGWNPDIDGNPWTGEPFDANFPEECRVTHGISANYFTIRKDAAGAGADTSTGSIWGDSTGLTNLVGHEFQIQDDIGGQPSGQPSQYLCRTGYNPGGGWDGTFNSSGDPDWGEKSETLQAIVEHNNNLDAGEEPLPSCALLYAQGTYGDPSYEHAGGQNGRWRSQNLPEGDYWLFETRAPNKQIDNVNGQQERDVPGVQLLAEPILFKIWPEEEGNPVEGSPQSRYGASQLDVVVSGDEYLDRCSPGAPVGERPLACVNPTGYLMIIKDAVPLQLPLTGGNGATALTAGGAVLLLTAMTGIWWWRRRADAE